jgi:hypothetical protein
MPLVVLQCTTNEKARHEDGPPGTASLPPRASSLDHLARIGRLVEPGGSLWMLSDILADC